MDRRVHGDSMLRRIGQVALRVVGASQHVHELTELVAAVQSPVTTGRRIVVTGSRGGVGTSTVAALLGLVFAHHRADRVLAVDADPGFDPRSRSLPELLGVPTAASLSDLGSAGSRLATFEDVRPYLATGPAGLWTLAAHGMTDLSPAAYHAGLGLLGRFFAVTVTDCGSHTDDALRHGLLERAHAQVLVVPATSDAPRNVGGILENQAYQGHAALRDRTVVVLVAEAPRVRGTAEHALRRLPAGVAATVLAFDRHLAAAAEISTTLLAAGSQLAATRAAGDALTRALDAP